MKINRKQERVNDVAEVEISVYFIFDLRVEVEEGKRREGKKAEEEEKVQRNKTFRYLHKIMLLGDTLEFKASEKRKNENRIIVAAEKRKHEIHNFLYVFIVYLSGKLMAKNTFRFEGERENKLTKMFSVFNSKSFDAQLEIVELVLNTQIKNWEPFISRATEHNTRGKEEEAFEIENPVHVLLFLVFIYREVVDEN